MNLPFFCGLNSALGGWQGRLGRTSARWAGPDEAGGLKDQLYTRYDSSLSSMEFQYAVHAVPAVPIVKPWPTKR